MKKAFTMMELVLVLVILAVAAGIGTDIFRSVFDTYALSSQTTRLEMNANNAADVISNRLGYRVPQTTSIMGVNKDGEIQAWAGGIQAGISPLSASNNNGDGYSNAALLFFMKSYELERNFATMRAEGSTYSNLPSLSGYITNISSTSFVDSSGRYDDNITIKSAGSNLTGIDTSKYTVFVNNDSSLLYNYKYDDYDREYMRTAKYYYAQDSLATYGNPNEDLQSFTLRCNVGSSVTLNGEDIIVKRNGCTGDRPSMATTAHRIYLSKEVNKIYLGYSTEQDEKDNKNGILYLETCPVKADVTKNRNECYKSILARGVTSFRFRTLSNNPNTSDNIVFKLCLKEGEAEVCQSRLVR